jgi:hypothetical protein
MPFPHKAHRVAGLLQVPGQRRLMRRQERGQTEGKRGKNRNAGFMFFPEMKGVRPPETLEGKRPADPAEPSPPVHSNRGRLNPVPGDQKQESSTRRWRT